MKAGTAEENPADLGGNSNSNQQYLNNDSEWIPVVNR